MIGIGHPFVGNFTQEISAGIILLYFFCVRFINCSLQSLQACQFVNQLQWPIFKVLLRVFTCCTCLYFSGAVPWHHKAGPKFLFSQRHYQHQHIRRVYQTRPSFEVTKSQLLSVVKWRVNSLLAAFYWRYITSPRTQFILCLVNLTVPQ